MSKRKPPIRPGYDEGHPDDRGGPTWDSVKGLLDSALKDSAELGLSLAVGLCLPSGVGTLGLRHSGKWFVESVGDYMTLLGLGSYLEKMAKDEAAEAASVYVGDDDGDDEEEDEGEDEGGEGRPAS